LPCALPNAIERKIEMDALVAGFKDQAKRGVSPIQVIQGLGGTGKSQLALNYANKMADIWEEKKWFCALVVCAGCMRILPHF